jgi:O-antigen/teichoic acid export membrane protein
MANKLKTNFGYNLINVLTGLLFPLITFPYASRILMPSGMGQVQFYQSIINYIALFTALGIPLYAVKEIARVRDNIIERNRTAIEILILFVSLTLVGYLVVGGLCLFVTKVQEGITIFLLLSFHLILVALGAEWFYQGIEEFRYITIRSLAVRILSLVCLFIFVKQSGDLIVYALLIVLAEAGNNLLNFIHLKKFLSFNECFKGLDVKRHIKPALKIFVLNLIVSVYVNLDSVMLGFMTTNDAVGYYSAATKLTRALMGIATALGGVLLPYLSNEFNKGNFVAYKAMANKAISYMVMLYIPLTVGLFMTAPQLIPLFCGTAYGPSIMTLKILAPITLFLSISSVLGTRILYARNLENIVIASTSIGALINFTLNILFIPTLYQNGAAISSVIAEFCVTFSMLSFSRKFLKIELFNKNSMAFFIYAIIMCLPIIIIQHLPISTGLMFVVEVGFAGLVYFLLLLISKNEIFVDLCRVTGISRFVRN